MRRLSTMLQVSLALLGAGAVALLFARGQSLQSRLDDSEQLRAQLLSDIESSAGDRVALQQQVARLEDSLRSANLQLQNLSAQLQEARESANPDVDSIRQQVRQEIEREEATQQQLNERMMSIVNMPEVRRSQAAMSVNMEYGEFLRDLEVSDDRRNQIRELLVDIFEERTALSFSLTSGEIDATEFQRLNSQEYLFEQLQPLLSARESGQLASYQADAPKRTFRRAYGSQLYMSAPGLTEQSRNLVLDVLQTSWDEVSIDPATMVDPNGFAANYEQQRIDALGAVREELGQQLATDQMKEAELFFSSLEAQMQMSKAMREARMANPPR